MKLLEFANYRKVETLTREVKVKLQDAIGKLDQVSVPENDRQMVVDSIPNLEPDSIREEMINWFSSSERMRIAIESLRERLPQRPGAIIQEILGKQKYKYTTEQLNQMGITSPMPKMGSVG